ncbi:MAG: DUF1353 domain-containing protein [Pseudomonadota bacterium]
MPYAPDFFRPAPVYPFPETFHAIEDFEYVSRLVLAREPEALKSRNVSRVSYIVAEPLEVRFKVAQRDGSGAPQTLTVPAGMLTDLTSVPWFGRAAVGKVGPHLEAAVVHDYLFIAWQLLGRKASRQDFDFANAVMFAAMNKADVKRWRQWLIRQALTRFDIAWGWYQEAEPGGPDQLFVRLDRRFAATTTGLEPSSFA